MNLRLNSELSGTNRLQEYDYMAKSIKNAHNTRRNWAAGVQLADGSRRQQTEQCPSTQTAPDSNFPGIQVDLGCGKIYFL
mmetsp:Transcript_19957/g.50854  ORF Transcript_19957/g.50854 Transcript_19957/m.50854 type:complete len:80 (-) Transcript_19957:1031-1270(-)